MSRRQWAYRAERASRVDLRPERVRRILLDYDDALEDVAPLTLPAWLHLHWLATWRAEEAV